MNQPKFQIVQRVDPIFVGTVAVFRLANNYRFSKREIEDLLDLMVAWCSGKCVVNAWKVTLFDFEASEQDHWHDTDEDAVRVTNEGADLYVSFNEEDDAALFTLTWC